MGFYLINVGFMSLMLGYGGRPTDTVEGIEHLGTKVGLVVVLLGVMHFTNMYVLMLFRRAALFRLIEAKAPAFKAGPWSTPQPTGHP